MRRVPKKPTVRGLGADEHGAETPGASDVSPGAVPLPPSVRVPATPLAKSMTQYSSHRHPPRETLSMPLPAKDALPPSSRRGTRRMPACLDEMGAATAAVTAGRSRSTIVRRLGIPDGLAERVSAREMRVLSFVDGSLSLRSLVDVSGMREGDVLAIVDRLARLKIVKVD